MAARGSFLLLVLACFALSFAHAVVVDFSQEFWLDDVERYGWQPVAVADPSTELDIMIALKHNNPTFHEDLKNELIQVSDMHSPRFRQWLSQERIVEIASPSEERLQLVLDWLNNKVGVSEYSVHFHREIVFARLTVERLQSIFVNRPEFNVYQNVFDGRKIVRTIGALHMSDRTYNNGGVDVTEEISCFLGFTEFEAPRKSMSQRSVRNRSQTEQVELCEGKSLCPPTLFTPTPFSSALLITVYLNTENLESVTEVQFKFVLNGTSNDTAIYQYLPYDRAMGVDLDYVFYGLPNGQVGYLSARVATHNDSSDWSLLNQPILVHDMGLPNYLRNFYGIPADLTGDGLDTSLTQGVFEYGGFSSEEVDNYWKAFGINANIDTVYQSGDSDGGLGGEQQLDVEVMSGVAQNISTVFLNSYASISFWIVEQSNETSPVLVQSTSWYMSEPSGSYLSTLEDSLMILGSRGVTMVTADGDDGAYGGGECQILEVQYPAASQYILSVGATRPMIDDTCTMCTEGIANQPYSYDDVGIFCASTSEIPVSIDTGAVFTTAGSFAEHVSMPWYQNVSVPAYLNAISSSDLPPYFIPTNRAYSDVVGIGSAYYTTGDIGPGVWGWNGGTSASAPMVAAVLSNVNLVLTRKGLPTIGFVNPMLYQLKEEQLQAFPPKYRVFNQMSNCNNRCGGWWSDLSSCCSVGFPCYDGAWSPTAGLGSINFQEFVKANLNY